MFIDGGVRRASDVLKAICLGAAGVGVGRPFLYAMSSYGLEGVEHAIQILKDEMEMNMRLIGAPTLSDLCPSMVDTTSITNRNVAAPPNNLYDQIYEPLPVLVRGGGMAARL